jgi:hypothetical protein
VNLEPGAKLAYKVDLQPSIGETMSVHNSPVTGQVSMVLSDTESDIAAKRTELRVLWDEICAGDQSPPGEFQSTTADRTDRLHQLIKELRNINRDSPPSYIDKLPDELLYTVFSLTFSPFPLDMQWLKNESEILVPLGIKRVRQVRSGDISLTLSMVCKRWQGIMLSSPSLWSSLIIGGESTEPEYLNLYLHLSRDHPLTLYLITPNEGALLALKPHAHRIRHLYIHIGTHRRWRFEFFSNAMTISYGHPQTNTTLRIPTSSILSLNLNLQSATPGSIHHFQHLQHLAICHAKIDALLIPDRVCLPYLRALTFGNIDGEEIISALKRLLVQTLQVLFLSFLQISYEQFISLQSYIYQMQNLISVELLMSELSPHDWIEDLLLPELFSSTIRQVELTWYGNRTTPLQFVAGIGPIEKLLLSSRFMECPFPAYCFPATLRELELHTSYKDTQEMQEISLPFLEKLILHMPCVYADHLLHKLFAPSLTRLEVESEDYGVFGTIYDFTSFRDAIFIHTPQLQHLEINRFALGSSGNVLPLPQLRNLKFHDSDWGFFTSIEAPQLLELTLELSVVTTRMTRAEYSGGSDHAPGRY